MSEPSDLIERVSRILPDNDAVLAVLGDPEAARFLGLGAEIAIGSGFGIAKRTIPILLCRQDADGGVSGEALLIFLRDNRFLNAANPAIKPYFVEGVVRRGIIAGVCHAKRHIAAMLFRAPIIYSANEALFSLD